MSATAKLQKDLHRSKEILTGCSAIIVGYSETHCERFVTEAGQSLFEHAKAVRDNNEQRLFDETSQYLDSRSTDLSRHFEDAIKRCFDEIYNGQSHAPKSSTQDESDTPEELALVADSETEISIAISSMAHRIDARCTQALYGLTQRMAMLNSGVKIDEEKAPYSASFLTQTFFKFIEKAELELSIQLLLLKLFERSFIYSLPNLYRELNNYLVTSNVLPNLRYGKGATRNNRRKTDPLLAASESRQAEIYQTLESLFNASPQPINPASPMMSVEQALSELATQPGETQDLLGQASQASFPNTNSMSLQHALDCVAMLFELVNDENSLGAPVRNLLSHLRNPYARIALSDPDFLADPQHQARQLMHSLVSAVEQWTDETTDPTHELVQHVKSIVERVISEASTQRPDAEQFESLLDEFNQYMDTFERKIQRKEQRSIEAAEGREKLQQNQNTVDELIRTKTNNQELPKPVAGLLNDTWASYMTYILLRYGEDSEQWGAAAAAVDSVLWYIEPKTSQAELDEAKSMQTTLHSVLRAGMEQVGLTASEIKGRLKGLELCQQLATENVSSTIQNSQSDATETQGDASIQRETAAPKNTEARPTTAGEPDQPVIIENQLESGTDNQIGDIAGASVVDSVVDNIDTTPPAQHKPKSRIQQQQEAMAQSAASKDSEGEDPQQQAASDADIQAVLKLKFGTWLDWKEPGKPRRRLKLTWYNRKSTNCMLSNKAGQEVGIFSARAIATGIVNGHVEIVGQNVSKPLFERMLEKFSQKSGNATIFS